eukprot:SAG31_NODE_21865_length_539_cov_0.700000_1_plen_100_part_00
MALRHPYCACLCLLSPTASSHCRATLDNLASQRSVLKGAQKRIYDVMNTLGISSGVMKNIDGRRKMDACLVYLGMVATLALIFFLYRWKTASPAVETPE